MYIDVCYQMEKGSITFLLQAAVPGYIGSWFAPAMVIVCFVSRRWTNPLWHFTTQYSDFNFSSHIVVAEPKHCANKFKQIKTKC